MVFFSIPHSILNFFFYIISNRFGNHSFEFVSDWLPTSLQTGNGEAKLDWRVLLNGTLCHTNTHANTHNRVVRKMLITQVLCAIIVLDNSAALCKNVTCNPAVW